MMALNHIRKIGKSQEWRGVPGTDGRPRNGWASRERIGVPETDWRPRNGWVSQDQTSAGKTEKHPEIVQDEACRGKTQQVPMGVPGTDGRPRNGWASQERMGVSGTDGARSTEKHPGIFQDWRETSPKITPRPVNTNYRGKHQKAP